MTAADTAYAKACKGEGYKFPVLWAFLWVIGIDENFCTKMSWKFSRDAVARLNCGHSELPFALAGLSPAAFKLVWMR